MFTRKRLTRWTNALRANPEQQHMFALSNKDKTLFCCLGKLCEVENVYYASRDAFLPDELRKDFGSYKGKFCTLKMPDLWYEGKSYDSASIANDQSVPWPVIAEHFDKYYPCSDE